MKVRIEIDTKTFVRFWLVVIGFALAILAIYSARTALILIGIAFFLAMALNAPVSRLVRIFPGKSRVGGTAVAFSIVVIILAVFIFLVLPPIAQQTAKFVDKVPSIIDNTTKQWDGFNHLVDKYHIRTQVDGALTSVKNQTASWATDLGQGLISGVGSLLFIIVSTFLVLVLSFLMLVEGPDWLNRIWGVYEDEERMERHRRLAERMYAVVTGYVTGQLIIASIGAICAGLAVFIISLFLNIPSSLAFPAMAIVFMLTLVPLFGATLGGIIVALLLGFNDFTAAIVFAAYFIIYQQIENSFISPTVQSRKVELSALTVLASVTIGIYVFGIAGGLISIPVAGCTKVLLEDYLERAKKRRQQSDKPFAKLAKKLQGEEV